MIISKECDECLRWLNKENQENLEFQRQELIKRFEKMFLKFVKESDVDGRKISFRFYDTDYYDFIKQLQKLKEK